MAQYPSLSEHETNAQLSEPDVILSRELFYIGIILVSFPLLFHGAAQFTDPAVYVRFFDPVASASIIVAGVLTLILYYLNHHKAAWICIIACCIVCGFFTAGIEALGEGYSLTIYVIVTFLALIALPNRSWQIVAFICLLSVALQKFLQIQVLESASEISNAYIALGANVCMFVAYVLVVWLLYRQLAQHIAQLQTVNNALGGLNSDLERSKLKSSILMETGLDPFFLIKPSGEILEVNQRACDLFGYSEAELLDRHAEELAPIGTVAGLKWIHKVMRKHSELRPLRASLVKKDGTRFEGEIYGRLVELDDQPMMYIAARDITHYLEQDRALHEKNALLEMITQNLPARIAYFDKEANLHFHNRAYATTYRPNQNGKNEHIASMFSPEEKAKRSHYAKRTINEGVPLSFDLDEILPDGTLHYIKKTYVPHIENGEVVGLVSLGVDVTELRTIQQSLEENNVLLDHVLNSMPARIAYIRRDGTVLFVNNRLYEDFNIRPEDVIGHKIRTHMPAEYSEAIEPHVRKAFTTGEQSVFETALTHANGMQVIERSYYYPYSVDGKVEGLFTLHMDVTDIRETETALARSQKLESLGILAGGIAHDFNNLLVAILGQGSLALAKMEPVHPARHHVEQSVSAAKRASVLTQQMLAYSGRGSFTVGLIDMNKLIEGNMALFSVSIPKNVQLNTQLCDTLPLIEADTAQMQQLIMNLIINAGQAIGSDNGRITITTRVEDISAERGEFWQITGDPLVPGRYVSIQVQDDGAGMTKETVNQIFDPFFTTKESGTGLGLAAALGIIRGHKGGIHLYSEAGHGTVFHLMFPACVETSSVIPIALNSAEISKSGQTTILVIDDEEDIVSVVHDMLELSDIACLKATNGQDGVALYRQHQDKITLVLLDLMMPGMSGQDVFLALRQINPKVQIILSSGYNRLEATRHFVGRGLADFIQKPYDFDTLISAIQQATNNPSALPELAG